MKTKTTKRKAVKAEPKATKPKVKAKTKTRQQEWQEAQVKAGNCRRCGEKRKHYAQHCDRCQVALGVSRRRKAGTTAWRKGGRGRPPKVQPKDLRA